MTRKAKETGYFGVLKDGKWTGEWSEIASPIHTTSTLASLREPTRYWVVSDAQLARDLRLDGKGRTIADVYRENRAGRRFDGGAYVPRWESEYQSGGGLSGVASEGLRLEYLAHCKARGHVPHPASIHPGHEIHRWRVKCPPREFVRETPAWEAAYAIAA